MAKEQSSVKERTRVIPPPGRYQVIILNDDFTTMEFVVKILVEVFNKPASEAMALMLMVHHRGSAVAGVYTLDIAMSKKEKAEAMARAENFPLSFNIVLEDGHLPF